MKQIKNTLAFKWQITWLRNYIKLQGIKFYAIIIIISTR